jgi:hypothetical protein
VMKNFQLKKTVQATVHLYQELLIKKNKAA